MRFLKPKSPEEVAQARFRACRAAAEAEARATEGRQLRTSWPTEVRSTERRVIRALYGPAVLLGISSLTVTSEGPHARSRRVSLGLEVHDEPWTGNPGPREFLVRCIRLLTAYPNSVLVFLHNGTEVELVPEEIERLKQADSLAASTMLQDTAQALKLIS